MSRGDLCTRCAHERKDHIYDEGPCRPGFVCEAKCGAFQGAVEVHPVVAVTERRIAKWIREQGDVYLTLITNDDMYCVHGHGHWEDCGECSMIQLSDDIDAGKWRTKGADQ